MKLRRLVLALAGVVLLAACGESASDAAFGAKVRKYLLEHPEVLQEAVTKLQEKEFVQGKAALAKAIADNRKAIERDRRDFVANPGGRITVTEFFDYRCGYCKAFAPEMVRLIAANPDIRFVFKEYPIFGGDSDKAARVALAVHKEGGRYLPLYNELLAEKTLDAAAIDRILRAQGYNPTTIHATGASPEVTQHIADVSKLARDLRIAGTPAFIVGDTMVEGADTAALQAAIDTARKDT